MKRFVEGVDRSQGTLFPDRLEDWIGDDNPVRAIDVFVDALALGGLGFDRVAPLATGRPASISIERLGFASEDLEDCRETRDVEDLPDDLVEAADP